MIRNSQQDALLRLIQQMTAVVAQMRGLRGGGKIDEALEVARTAEGELLGPVAAAATVVDAATAAQMIGEPLKAAAWARLLHERAALLRDAGDPAAADAVEARAGELAREARARAGGDAAAIEGVLGPLQPAKS